MVVHPAPGNYTGTLVNALNIIINDGDCNDTFIENICQKLEMCIRDRL